MKALPTMIATARSSTFPRAIKSKKSCAKVDIPFKAPLAASFGFSVTVQVKSVIPLKVCLALSLMSELSSKYVLAD